MRHKCQGRWWPAAPGGAPATRVAAAACAGGRALPAHAPHNLSRTHQLLHVQAKHAAPADLQPLPPQAVAARRSILNLRGPNKTGQARMAAHNAACCRSSRRAKESCWLMCSAAKPCYARAAAYVHTHAHKYAPPACPGRCCRRRLRTPGPGEQRPPLQAAPRSAQHPPARPAAPPAAGRLRPGTWQQRPSSCVCFCGKLWWLCVWVHGVWCSSVLLGRGWPPAVQACLKQQCFMCKCRALHTPSTPLSGVDGAQVGGVQLGVALAHLPQVLHRQLHQPEQLHIVVAGQRVLRVDAALLQLRDGGLQPRDVVAADLCW